MTRSQLSVALIRKFPLFFLAIYGGLDQTEQCQQQISQLAEKQSPWSRDAAVSPWLWLLKPPDAHLLLPRARASLACQPHGAPWTCCFHCPFSLLEPLPRCASSSGLELLGNATAALHARGALRRTTSTHHICPLPTVAVDLLLPLLFNQTPCKGGKVHLQPLSFSSQTINGY